MKPQYIFVVGLPRTGTKLVSDILQNSQHVHCKISPENFFLGHLIRPGVRHQLRQMGDMADETTVRKLVEAMYAGQFAGTYWEMLQSGYLGVEKEKFVQAILASGRSEKDIYEVMMRIHPDVTPETILGDKNPGHLYHVPTLLAWFPEAKVIHTFRDPRAILVSEWRRRMKERPATFLSTLTKPFYSLLIVLHVTITWLYAVRLHHRYRKQYPHHYYLSKFEDLVTDSERSVKNLCQFLEIEFHPEMLSPRKVGSSYARDGGAGFDAQALTRWQDHLTPWMQAWLLLWSKKYLREFGYIR
jgi:hypothetical protein